MLKFSKANTKLKQLQDIDELSPYLQNKRKVYSFDLLSGWSCPFAVDCLSKVHLIDGKKKIKDGKNCQFRCFSASQEVVFPAVYDNRKHNFDAMRSFDSSYSMACAIADAMPINLGINRIHVGGDFFNQKYFRAWHLVAEWYPDRLFYAYTKSLSWWVEDRDSLPDNLVLTASRGGRLDFMIDEFNLREAKVVFSEAEAEALGYEIDHDDSHAAIPSLRDQSFALLIHGQQPAGSDASAAIKELKKNNVKFSYGKTTPLEGV
jgi:hypothetical protein